MQFINGETFYNLSNLNTQRHINIAGNTVVTNNLVVGAGGIIRTSGNVYTAPGENYFTPAGGTFELTGSGSSTITLESVCYFHDLKINKSPDISVNASSPITIHNELKISGGKFNTNNFPVTVGE